MKFQLKTTASDNDITVANISTKRIRSEHVMNITDYSAHYTDNTISLTREIQSAIDNIPSSAEMEGVRLGKYNIFNKILLTNEYKYSLEQGTKIPLYYSHRINNNIYTKNVTRKSIRKKVTTSYYSNERRVKGLIPRTGKYIIPVGSIDVYLVGTPNIKRTFFMDYGSGELVIEGNINIDETYLITYLLVEDKFTVEESESEYRISLEKIYPSSDNFFSMNILAASKNPITVKYMSAETDGRAKEYTSNTIGELIFTEVPEPVRATMVSGTVAGWKVYSLVYMAISDTESDEKEFIVLPSGSVYDSYTFKSSTTDTSIVKVKQVANINYNSDWYVEITPGFFTENGVIYGTAAPLTKTRRITEETIRVTKNIVSITRDNPIIKIDEYGRPSGIRLYSNTDENISIEKVDTARNLVFLSEPTRMSDTIWAEYAIENNTVVYPGVSFNPLVKNTGLSADMDQYVIAILSVPKLRCDTGGTDRYIYHLLMPKYTKTGIKNYSYEDIMLLLNGEENIRSAIPGLDTGSVSSDDLIVLGTVYLSNCLDEDGYLMEDARVFGGGLLSPERGFFDMSFYDGERTDLNTILHVFIKQEIFNDLYSRVLDYDREVRRFMQDQVKMEQVAYHRTMEIINGKLEKFLPFGTEWEVIIG